MTTLNGLSMKRGDVVYDIIKGAGTVINDGGGVLNVTVDFGASGQMNFTQDGKFQGQQRLYWKNPVFLQARGPNDQAFDATMKLLPVLYEFLTAYEIRQKNSQ